MYFGAPARRAVLGAPFRAKVKDKTKTIFKIIFRVFAGLLLAFVLFTLFFAMWGSSFAKIKHAGNYTKVMRDGLGDNLDCKVAETAMLGAHNAFSAGISGSSGYDKSEASALTQNSLIKGMAVRFSKAQTLNAYDLACAGARYFDISLAYNFNEWHTKNIFISNKLSESLLGIIQFLYENPGEFVVLDFTNVYLNDLTDYESLFGLFKETKNEEGFSIINFTYKTDVIPLENLTYGNITLGKTKGGAVILIDYEKSAGNNFYYNRKESPFKINNAYKTASAKKPFSAVFGWSLIDMANGYNPSVLKNGNLNEIFAVTPILSVDFINCSKNDFNNKINEFIIDFNKTHSA